MTRKQKRLSLIALAGVTLALAMGLILYALNDKIVFFYSPSDLAQQSIASGKRVRIGGLVENGSVKKNSDRTVDFRITDTTQSLAVRYSGTLPDLFREGQGVVAEGIYQGSEGLIADTVLAKHDERYMPREVTDALKKQGVWQGGKGQ
jgi:cytochrome c-type biogenesis protein CcmE